MARQDTITQLIVAIRRFGRELAGGEEPTAAHGTGYDYARTGKPEIAWDGEDAKDTFVTTLVTDVLALLAAVDSETLDGKAADAYALLALVARQDVEPADGSDGTDGRWRIAGNVAPDRVDSTVDAEARHAHKTRQDRRDGYKAHIVIEPDTGLVTAGALTKAAGQGFHRCRSWRHAAGAGPNDHRDGSGAGRLRIRNRGTTQGLGRRATHALIKPKPLARAIESGFTIDDFAYEEHAGTLTCPNGQVRTITAKGHATFGAACKGCPLRSRCTTAARGRKIELHPEHALMREHRAAARAEGSTPTTHATSPWSNAPSPGS